MTWWWESLAAAVAGSAVLLYVRSRQAVQRSLARHVAAERALEIGHQEVERLIAALAGVADGLVVLDAAHCIVACNQPAQELASLPANGGRGRALADLVPWPGLVASLQRLRSGADGGAPGEEFEQQERIAGEERTLLVRVRSLGHLGVVVAIDDQSRLRRLESLRRDFVANVSHELKTPLAAIQGFVETLLDDPDMPSATRQRFLDRIARQTERLTTLVADLLTLSRLDEPRAYLDPFDPCDLVAVVRETLRDLQPLADRRHLSLQPQLAEATMLLAADREGLRQVVGNLVDNAIKYTPEGGTVTVRLLRQGDQALLEVEDTGIGLSPADQERVFERFYRVDRARSRELGGTGLGLSIVKNTVRACGGEVGVRSKLGAGSTFWVRLPVHRSVDAG